MCFRANDCQRVTVISPKALGLEDKVFYFYGGNIGSAQDMMNIVRLVIAMRLEAKSVVINIGW